jgi:hypothetical protein
MFKRILGSGVAPDSRRSSRAARPCRRDPGYVVFRPLLLFNTAMGVVYVATGVVTLRSLARGKLAAAAIFVLNLLVLGIIGYVYATSSDVAIDSIRAMSFRTFVWLVVFLGLAWLDRGRHAPGSG